MIDLAPEHLSFIREIIYRHIAACKVYVFGSRNQGNAKKYSDLDLAVQAQGKLTIQEIGRITEDFQESSLPFRVDLHDWHRLSDEFRRIIEKDCELLPEWTSAEKF